MKKSILFVLFLLLVSYSVFGQITVSGKVINKHGALPNVTVRLKGTQMVTKTDIEGKYKILIEDNNAAILVFLYTGMESKEETVGDCTIIDIVLKDISIPLTIHYWSGLFYSPYGIVVNKGFYIRNKTDYFLFEARYGTNFKRNSDFYGVITTKRIAYIFQQTTFHKSDTENRITTHLLKSSSYLKFIKTGISYGIGHQIFTKKGLENDKRKNFGINLGLFKKVKYVGDISLNSFYWQDYFTWQTNINRAITKKIYTNIAYRQTTQDFKEINLTLGYIF